LNKEEIIDYEDKIVENNNMGDCPSNVNQIEQVNQNNNDLPNININGIVQNNLNNNANPNNEGEGLNEVNSVRTDEISNMITNMMGEIQG
jgi:hypothetical protein